VSEISRELVIAAARKVADETRPAATSTYNNFEDARAAAAVVAAFETFADLIEQAT
jgi:hypothetical protein